MDCMLLKNGPTGIIQVQRPRLGHYPSHHSGASYGCTKNGGDNRPYTAHQSARIFSYVSKHAHKP